MGVSPKSPLHIIKPGKKKRKRNGQKVHQRYHIFGFAGCLLLNPYLLFAFYFISPPKKPPLFLARPFASVEISMSLIRPLSVMLFFDNIF